MKLFWQIAVLGLFGTLAACGKEGSTDTEDTEDTEDTNVPETETDCDDGEDEDEDGDEDCEDADCASAEDCLWSPALLNASAAFTYDSAANAIVDVDIAGTAQPAIIDIFIGNQNFQDTSDRENDTCDILLIYNGNDELDLTTWTADVDGDDLEFAGIVLESGNYDIQTNCTDFPFDESVLGSVEDIAAMGWGAGVGPMSASDEDIIQGFVDGGQISEDDVPNYGGSGFFWGADGVPTPFLAGGYSVGWKIDPESYSVLTEDGTVATESDSPGFLLAEDFATGEGLPTGYYQTGSFSGWTLQAP